MMVRLLLAASLASCLLHGEDPMPVFRPGAHILFQGDSITDGNRGRNGDPNHILGHGYAFLIAARFGAAMPERNLIFLNRGISGNKVSDLAARWEKDALELKPDMLSILIGINDSMKKVPIDDFENVYDGLLAAAVAANPKVHQVLCEPFILPVGRSKQEFEEVLEDVKLRQAVVFRLAVKYRAAVVHFQKVFDDACKRAPAEYWIWDGVHPTYSGHQLMAEEWVRVVSQLGM